MDDKATHMRSEQENDVLQAVKTGKLAEYLLAPPIYNAWGWNKYELNLNVLMVSTKHFGAR